MSLKGNLENFFIASILQLLCFDKKTGTLQVTCAAHTAKVFFKDGTIIFASESNKDTRLAGLMQQEGIITPEQARECLEDTRQSGISVGKILVQKNYLQNDQLATYLRKQVETILYTLFLRTSGHFSFSEHLPDISGKIIFEMDTMGLILEASRMVDEFSVLAKQIPHERTIFSQCNNRASQEVITLTAQEWHILSLINTRRSVRDLIDDSGYDEFSMYKIIYSLISSGLVEPCGTARPQQPDNKQQKTILVADDMVQIRKILNFSLHQAGYEVVTAENGQQALDIIFGPIPPDLIILDIMMPLLDGYAVIKKIRNTPATSHIPVIFLTAQTQKADVLNGIKAGANGYVVKPYKFADLLEKIEPLLEE
ncbi:MAG: response regulator [Deltaproteobacteria bacterium]|nr:response regulator [Deltaproteobacteria bacterium]